MRVPQRAERTPNPSFPRIGLTSKLRFDRPLVEHRPDLRDSFAPELIEDVLGEIDPPAVHRETEKQSLGLAVEAESARHMGRVADQKFDVEMEVRDLLEVALEHGAIAGEAEWPAIVTRVVSDEAIQVRPVRPVEAGDIGPVEVGEGLLGSYRAILDFCFNSTRGVPKLHFSVVIHTGRVLHNDSVTFPFASKIKRIESTELNGVLSH
jgi:hypothetical protein